MTYITDINSTLPADSDSVGDGASQIRALKFDVATSFPNINAAVTSNPTELNLLDGTTVSTADLDKLSAVTSTAAELNVLDGIPAGLTATELGYVDGVTSAIQTQLTTLDNGKADLAGDNTQTFDVAVPTATDQAIRRDSYAVTSGGYEGGTVRIRVDGTDLYISTTASAP